MRAGTHVGPTATRHHVLGSLGIGQAVKINGRQEEGGQQLPQHDVGPWQVVNGKL